MIIGLSDKVCPRGGNGGGRVCHTYIMLTSHLHNVHFLTYIRDAGISLELGRDPEEAAYDIIGNLSTRWQCDHFLPGF